MTQETITLEVIKAIEIKPHYKYLLVLPAHLLQNKEISARIQQIFADNPCVIIGSDNPKTLDGIKVIETKNDADR